MSGFPDFAPYIQGLKDVKPESDGPEYQVCVQRGSKLVVLGAYANKWLQSDTFKADAKTLIDAHNENYNADGDYVEEPERTASFKKQLVVKTYVGIPGSFSSENLFHRGVTTWVILIKPLAPGGRMKVHRNVPRNASSSKRVTAPLKLM